MDDLLAKIAQYGYPGLLAALVLGILGLPIPDETVLTFCGYLVAKGNMHWGLTWLTALVGSISGISLSYLIGRLAGQGFIHRYGRYVHFTQARMDQVLHWFDRIGHWLLTIGYYLPGVRHFTALVAGMSGMSYRSFALYAYPGAALWITTFIGIGYVLGDRWREVFESLHREMLIVLVIALVVAWILWKVFSRRAATKAAKIKANPPL